VSVVTVTGTSVCAPRPITVYVHAPGATGVIVNVPVDVVVSATAMPLHDEPASVNASP
jgi:hypothetical protein